MKYEEDDNTVGNNPEPVSGSIDTDDTSPFQRIVPPPQGVQVQLDPPPPEKDPRLT
ncbi:MAG: hypothetical protein WC526_04255 [Patescibacteria group bacterium]